MLSEIKKDKKKLIKDPIKRMSYNGSGSAREVVRMIALALGFKIHEDEHGISAYGGNAIRIADHCTYMQTWVDRGTWNAPIRLDVVIEEKPTQAVTQVKKGFDFTIAEFVYDINDVDPQNARTIAYDIRNVINGNQYANNARGERRALKSTHNSNENKQYNKNRNMKQTIRLTENETIYTNSKERYRGVPGTTFIWHGNNADPEVIYKGKSFNVNDVEDNLWYTYKDECEENGEHPTDQGFEAWLQEVGTSYIATTLDEILWSTQG